jgi:hypothetical protein
MPSQKVMIAIQKDILQARTDANPLVQHDGCLALLDNCVCAFAQCSATRAMVLSKLGQRCSSKGIT